MHEVLERLAAEWERCAKWIEPSLAYANGCYDMASLWEAVVLGKMQLWPGERSAMLSEIVRFPLKTGCTVAFAGGDMEELKRMQVIVEDWARSKGCDFISVHGRRGWVRALGVGRVVSTTASRDL